MAWTLTQERRLPVIITARTISVFGSGVARVALSFGILALPGVTPVQLSIVLASQVAAQVTFVLIGGVIADRRSRGALLAVTDLLNFAAYATMAAMFLAGHVSIPALAILAGLSGLATALFSPAMTAVVPDLVEAERLQRANALLRIGANGAMVAGLACSGMMVARLGTGWALAVNAASFLVSAALTLSLGSIEKAHTRDAPGWRDLRDGWREFSSRQWLWIIVLQYSLVVAASNATIVVLGPLTAQRDLGGATTWSMIVGAQAVGTIAGAGIATRIRPARPVLIGALATLPIAFPMLLLGIRAPLWTIAGAMFVSGASSDVFLALWTTTLQRRVPPAALSRVSSYDWFGSLALASCGVFAAGPLASAFGSNIALIGCGAFSVLATSGAMLSPQVRTLGSESLKEDFL
ncbi:MFS transporter [Actinoallomurus iriomotensis]|uniref:MFS transporter n=1 Tax=Actinoallomurus iriomotensis TaxID=478107 RepID=A0A9W6RUZ5_9ACTN|nr:MFS transporter [Actinoallomurus iriomotensis]GLY82336.1 MFS transporter [Actinoallomurus iriomotensis]